MKSASHIMVGLSGGVDSAIAAYQLKEGGYQVSSLFMKNWDEDDRDGHCSAEQDLQDASAVAKILNIPLYQRNFSHEYWQQVFEHFLAEYAAGRTPNPDILCNREIKFSTFLQQALDLGADAIATGHYAQIEQRKQYYLLMKGADPGKDQSYFLHLLNQAQLSKALFPIGHLQKTQVREIASQLQLPNSSKKDSTGICFIGERNFKEFLQQYLPAQPGDIKDLHGAILGRHDGLMYYTLGQRQGLGLGGMKDGNGEPWYVVDKDLANNTLVVAQGHQHPALFKTRLKAQAPHWVAQVPPQKNVVCRAKTRYRQADQDCRIIYWDEEQLEVEFKQPQRAVTPGQSVVFYDGPVCLGGAVIADAYD